MEKLYSFECCCGRMGDLDGVFAVDEQKAKDLIGTVVHFGEVLGKHSDISVEIKEEHLQELTSDQDFIAKAKEFKVIPTGYNPLDFIYEEDED